MINVCSRNTFSTNTSKKNKKQKHSPVTNKLLKRTKSKEWIIGKLNITKAHTQTHTHDTYICESHLQIQNLSGFQRGVVSSQHAQQPFHQSLIGRQNLKSLRKKKSLWLDYNGQTSDMKRFHAKSYNFIW